MRKFSQEQLAEKAGISRQYLADLERGKIVVPRDPENLKALAAALGIRLRDLAEPTGWYDESAGGDTWEQMLFADDRLSDDAKQALARLIRLELAEAEREEKKRAG